MHKKNSQTGATLVEYALLLSFVALVILCSARSMGIRAYIAFARPAISLSANKAETMDKLNLVFTCSDDEGSGSGDGGGDITGGCSSSSMRITLRGT